MTDDFLLLLLFAQKWGMKEGAFFLFKEFLNPAHCFFFFVSTSAWVGVFLRIMTDIKFVDYGST